ncbi:putative membrane protein [Erythrobacter sp. NAP1]|uniref:MerC domain-containing protein n=1 Tax=Erythrobacter sp. NAP1 TaxID=237727 RepID=UPI0000686D4F|nr:MerC domain-containing protein [Erythrobacter sp. NAP1]EAQ29890.1 putative membrane protein [Erythrobacter sp. NAP1]
MSATASYDRAAAALSLACIVHCVALPIVAITLPFLAGFAETEWVHWLLTGLAIAASATVIGKAPSARTLIFLIPVLSGMGLIGAALFAEPFGVDETIPTLAGGLLMASAHIWRLRQHA